MSYHKIGDEEQDSHYPVYPQRFLVTTLYSLGQMMTSVLMSTINPIAADLSIVYQYSPIVINLSGLLYILMHPLFTFPAAYVIDTKGVRVSIILGSLLAMLGISLRLFVNFGFWTVILGQVLAGIGRPFILNCQAKVSANWFHASKRGGVTQLLTLVVNVSLIIGILIPGIMFSGYHAEENNPTNIEQGKSLTFKLMLVESIMGLLCFIPNILFQIEKPPLPPSESGYLPREPFSVAVKQVFKQKDYVLLLLSFGMYFGVFNGISITLAFFLEPWFQTDSMVVALVGGSPIISGVVGVIILGPIQRRSGVFKKWVLICMIGSSSAMLLFYPILQTYSVGATAFISAYNSFFLIPLVPIMLELGCELAYPVGEGTAVGLLFAVGNLFGFFSGTILSIIVKGETKAQTAWGLGFCLGMFLLGIGMTLFMKEDLKRRNAERASMASRDSQSAKENLSESIKSVKEEPQAVGGSQNMYL